MFCGDLVKILQCGSTKSKTALFFSASEKIFFGLVKMTFGLLDISYSLPYGKTDFLCTLKWEIYI